MKRVHLFEFEDFAWFPNWLRVCMTRYIQVVHQLLGTQKVLAPLVKKLLSTASGSKVIDLCSGSGGPMPDVARILKAEGVTIDLTLSDLYPNQDAARYYHEGIEDFIRYETNQIEAQNAPFKGIRTLVCSMHHMRPKKARMILKNAVTERQPICIFEISDNSAPIFLFWLAIPIAFVMVLFLTPKVRPMTWQQLVFTYLIPLLPLFVAWDGAVSNARTYTLEDLDELLSEFKSSEYVWEKGKIKGKGLGRMIYCLGYPTS